MFYIVEHDTAGDAVKWLSKHYKNKSYAVNNSIFGMMTSPFYEIKEATEEEVKRWQLTHSQPDAWQTSAAGNRSGK